MLVCSENSLYRLAKIVKSQRFRLVLLMTKYTSREKCPWFPGGTQGANLGEGESKEEYETRGRKRRLKKQVLYR